MSRLYHTAWQTQVHTGTFNKDNINSANTSYVGNKWCNFLLLLFFSHLQAFWPSCATKMWETCHSLEGWGNTAILSRKEQSQSPSQYVDHWRVYILSSSMDARIWCLWWHISSLISNMKPSQNGNYLSHSKRLTLDICFDRLWGITKTPS